MNNLGPLKRNHDTQGIRGGSGGGEITRVTRRELGFFVLYIRTTSVTLILDCEPYTYTLQAQNPLEGSMEMYGSPSNPNVVEVRIGFRV